ncbi:TetR/AcrR family transcriptional regulator [Actinomadura rupiterrae]|uniref:TetR/AcrR family transcriptional regulator n=1 Tax=Actinomadura rupiterrae TaxID=559627 RepID=UPI0020A5349B|nr:TetR/AcrR family transcriptional regulator [Actinomadura rupiterrae]MCP2335844.1 AcrR family transcriptional regulator [Actinomadura rupiterrae]
MNASRTARERARAELTREIKEEARRQLAASGAQGLSLRAVSREMGMVSSALYRYFPSRDDLLTALIVDAYDAVGERAEQADREAAQDGPRARWRAVCAAVRGWAAERPHEYALIYGSPVPGYAAPEDTIAPATRVPFVLLGIVQDAATSGRLDASGPEPGPELTAQLKIINAAAAPDVPAPATARLAAHWAQLTGLISFELFGQFANTLDPADEFFAYSVERMADDLGFPA